MCAWKNVLQASLLQKCLRRDSKYTFLATALVILLIWACHLSWSSSITPRWRCSETCSITCEFSMRRRGGILRWCFWRVATTILLVFSGLSNIVFAEHHSVTSWILGCRLAFIAAMLFPDAERDESNSNMSQSTSVDEILNGRSFIEILKRRGPRTDPSGTPTSTEPSGE